MHTQFCFAGKIWQARSHSLAGIWHENNCKVSICGHACIDLTITLNHSIWQFNFSSPVFIWKQPPPMEASASLPSSVLQLRCHSLLSSLNAVSVIVRPGWSAWLLPSAMFSSPVVIWSFSKFLRRKTNQPLSLLSSSQQGARQRKYSINGHN